MADDLICPLHAPDPGQTPVLSQKTVSILKTVPMTRLSFRGRDNAVQLAETALGLALPTAPLTASCNQNKAALWLGPDEWLLLAPEDDQETLTAAFETALSDIPHALVDISQRQDAILITGPKAPWLLNSGIPIDLDLAAFPVGHVTRTVFHKASVMIWRIGTDAFILEAWGSFMEYVMQLLLEAAQELATA